MLSMENNHFDLNEKRTEKELKKSDKRPPLAQLYKMIAQAIDRNKHSGLPKFPQKFKKIYLEDKIFITKEHPDRTLEIMDDDNLLKCITDYSHDVLSAKYDGFSFDMRQVKAAKELYKYYGEVLPEPKMVGWLNDEGYAFTRLPWDYARGETPVFDELLSRTTNAEALQCFIGSLFFPEADRQQYCWCFGTGQNGKSALSRFLKQAFGRAYSAQQPPSRGDKFWTSGLLGKRIIVFPDCNENTFICGSQFKSLTGGDPVRVELKGGGIFTTDLDCKFLFLSNERPKINSEKADLRRLMLCEMEEIKVKPDPQYNKKMWAEGGYFLSRCIDMYKEKCPKHEMITVMADDEKLNDWVSTVEEDFETVFAHNFKLNDKFNMAPIDMQKILKTKFNSRYEADAFRSWLERKHKIKKKTIRVYGRTIKAYPGIEPILEGEIFKSAEMYVTQD